MAAHGTEPGSSNVRPGPRGPDVPQSSGSGCASQAMSRSTWLSSPMWPAASSTHASAPGMCAASQSPCAGGHEHVGAPVGQHDRNADVGDVEAPRPGEGDVVVDPAVDPGREAVDHLGSHALEVLHHHRLVRLGQVIVVAHPVDPTRRRAGSAASSRRPVSSRRLASSPSSAAWNSRTLPSVWPSSQSSPSAVVRRDRDARPCSGSRDPGASRPARARAGRRPTRP